MITPKSSSKTNKRYGVKLVHYKGQLINLFIFEDDKVWSGTLLEAREKIKEYERRNPGGYYCEEEVAD